MDTPTYSKGVQVEDTKICVVMVGLPARGKSYIAQKGTFCSLSHLDIELRLLFVGQVDSRTPSINASSHTRGFQHYCTAEPD
jgi:hypothetical protein